MEPIVQITLLKLSLAITTLCILLSGCGPRVMRIRTTGVAACALFLSLSLPQVRAEDSPPAQPTREAVAVEVFKGPKAIKVVPAPYPSSEVREGKEGWVEVNFMIDPQGKPYEVTVVDSTGNREFERATIRAAEGWTFEPARQGDRPISVGHRFKHTFVLRDAGKARVEFVRRYRKLGKAIEAGDKAAADELLPTLAVQNLYEDAFANLARYDYYRRWGTPAQQLGALRRAMAYETAPRYLDRKDFVAALHAVLTLEVQTQDFGSALETWELLQKYAPAETVKALQAPMQELAALRDQRSPYGVPGKIDDRGSWTYLLFRNRFQLAVSGGHVSEIKLRCQKQYVLFRFQEGVEYTIDDKHGACYMEVLGDLGTEFQLIQS